MSATSGAAQGGSKAAHRGEEHEKPKEKSQRETRAHVISARHKCTVSESTRPLTNVNSKQDGGKPKAMLIEAQETAVTIAKTVNPSTGRNHLEPTTSHQFPRP